MKKQYLWTLIERLGWERNNYDYKEISKVFWTQYTPEERAGIRKLIGECFQKMDAAERKYELSKPLDIWSDDGYSDVRYHVIGLGKEEFDKAVANPYLLEKRYKAGYGTKDGYKESFAYCFLRPEPEAVKKTFTDIEIKSCREQIQEDLLCVLDCLSNDIQTKVCQVVVDNFKKTLGI